jgi:hypothetical protein
MIYLYLSLAYVAGFISAYGIWIWRKGKLIDDARNTGFAEGIIVGKQKGRLDGKYTTLITLSQRLKEEAEAMEYEFERKEDSQSRAMAARHA